MVQRQLSSADVRRVRALFPVYTISEQYKSPHQFCPSFGNGYTCSLSHHPSAPAKQAHKRMVEYRTSILYIYPTYLHLRSPSIALVSAYDHMSTSAVFPSGCRLFPLGALRRTFVVLKNLTYEYITSTNATYKKYKHNI